MPKAFSLASWNVEHFKNAPARVGDVVTLGDTSGVVSRIRMRATTVIDHDRKEYIVPNKDLVTERLLQRKLGSERFQQMLQQLESARPDDGPW